MKLNLYIIIVLVELVLPSWQQDSTEDINELFNKLIKQTNNVTDSNEQPEQPDDDSKIIIVKTFQEPIPKNESKDQSKNNTKELDGKNLNTRRNFGSDSNINNPEDDVNNILQEIIIEVEKVEDSEHIKESNDEDKAKKLLGEFLSKTGRSALDDNIQTKRPHVLSDDDILHSMPPDVNISNESETDEVDSISDDRSNLSVNDLASNEDVTSVLPNNDYQTNHKDIPRENLRLPIKKIIEKILRKKSLRTEHSISRHGNVRYVPPQIPLPIVQKPRFRIMEGPLSHNSLLLKQSLQTLPNRHIHYPINHFHLPYMGTNLQPSPWGNDYALQNALMRTSSLHNLKHFNYVTDLTNKMMSRVVYQPLYSRFL